MKQVVIKDGLPRALSESEVARLLDVIEDPHVKELILTYLYTGGRRTEIVRLLWQDFKEDAGQWRVHIRETKTKVRIIPLADNLKQILFQRKKDIGPLFPYYYGRPKEASKTFRHYADMAKLRHFKLHDLRHTAATFMILHGVSMKIVSEILGHASIKTTEIYTKLISEHLRDGINTLSF